MCLISHAQLFASPWTIARQALLSMGFPREEHWKGLPFPPPGTLPDPGIKPKSLVSLTLAGGFFTTEPPGKGDRGQAASLLIPDVDGTHGHLFESSHREGS